MLAVPCWLTQSGQSFTLLYGAEWPGALFCWLTQKWPGLMEPRWRSIYLEISPVSPSLNHGAYIITLGTLWSWEIHISNRTVSVSLFSKQVPTFHFETCRDSVQSSERLLFNCTRYSVLSPTVLRFFTDTFHQVYFSPTILWIFREIFRLHRVQSTFPNLLAGPSRITDWS